MVLLNFLRALADLGAYYAVAGMFSTFAGGQLALLALLLQSVCFAFSASIRGSNIARLAALSSSLLFLLLPVSMGDVLLFIPPFIYLGYLAWTDGYQLSWERQRTVFTVSIRAVVPIICVFAVIKFQAAQIVGIPAAILMAFASILLMRSLRHDSAVYLQPRYQLINSISIILLALAALALGSEWAFRSTQFLLAAVYEEVVVPLLTGAGMLISLFFIWIPWMVRSLWDPELPKLAELMPVKKATQAAAADRLPQIFAAALVVVMIVLFVLQRRQGGKRNPVFIRKALPGGYSTEHGHGRHWERTYAGRIRRQYRTFLQMCQRKGISIQPADTSTDIQEKSAAAFLDEASLTSLRDIYQKARYQVISSRADYQEFKRLLGMLKKDAAKKAPK